MHLHSPILHDDSGNWVCRVFVVWSVTPVTLGRDIHFNWTGLGLLLICLSGWDYYKVVGGLRWLTYSQSGSVGQSDDMSWQCCDIHWSPPTVPIESSGGRSLCEIEWRLQYCKPSSISTGGALFLWTLLLLCHLLKWFWMVSDSEVLPFLLCGTHVIGRCVLIGLLCKFLCKFQWAIVCTWLEESITQGVQ